MAFMQVRQEQPVFKKKKDTEGKILGGLGALGGAMVAAAPFTGGASLAVGAIGAGLAASSALRSATRPEPSPGSYSNVPQNANLVQPTTMANRLDQMQQNPVAQIEKAKTALDYLNLDQEQRLYYQKPLDEALARYQAQSKRGYA
jgi:hypothetical protein